MKHKRFMILCSLIGFLAVLTAAEDPRRQKMCWAHYVGWGFNQTDGYDLAMRSPLDYQTAETLRFVVNANILPVPVDPDQFDEELERYYPERSTRWPISSRN